MKTYKYNSSCGSEKHTDKPYEFVLHVARCKICQEKLPAEILKSLEPKLTELKTKIAATVKVKVEAETKEIKKADQPVDDIESRISNSPTIKRLGDSIGKIDKAIGVIAGLTGVVAEGEPANIPAKGEIAPVLEGEHITMSPELLQEAEQMAKDQGAETKIDKTTPPQKKEQEILPPIPGLPNLEDPKVVETMEYYIKQQKQKLGMEEEAPTTTQPPGTEIPAEKGAGGGTGMLTEFRDTVTSIKGIIDTVFKRGGGEGGESQKMMSDLFKQLFSAQLQRKDPIEYLIEGIKLGNSGGGRDSKRDVIEEMKLNNMLLTNAIKIVSGKGNLLPSEPSTEEIDTRIDKRLEKIIRPEEKGEHLD